MTIFKVKRTDTNKFATPVNWITVSWGVGRVYTQRQHAERLAERIRAAGTVDSLYKGYKPFPDAVSPDIIEVVEFTVDGVSMNTPCFHHCHVKRDGRLIKVSCGLYYRYQ